MASLFTNIFSWKQFKSKLEGLTKKQKGNAFEELSAAYLRLDPRYATKLKDIWPLRKVPVEVSDHLNLPLVDEGIDFVARTNEGKYWAIQCKFKDDESTTLGLGDLGTFTSLAFVTCKDKFDFALVITTASGLSTKFHKNYGNKIGQVASRDWLELDAEFFERLKSFAENRFQPITPRTPRNHQRKAIDAAELHFLRDGNARGKLIHPCASGKSLTGYWIAESLDAKTVLVVVPSLSLVRQALKDYLHETFANGKTANWIAVCSDDLKELVDGDRATLPQDLGIKIHTNVDEIADWLRYANSSQTFVFSTYQSGRALAAASRKAEFCFDLGIFDEAHRTVGKRDTLFSHLLFDENIAITRRVFMTATERFYRGGSDLFLCMSDAVIYGETFDVLSFKEALESDPPILCDYKIVTMDVTRTEVNELIEQNLFVQPNTGRWDHEVEAQTLACAVALRKAMAKYPIRHAISFHGSIARASAFQKTQNALNEAFPDFGELSVFHVNGSTPTAMRAKELDRFISSKRSLITNARCLTEGVDVPGIDCVLFADPKGSTIDIVQAVGRALRLAPEKEYGYVVVPVLIDSEISIGLDSDFGPFEPVMTVLRALGSNDDRIIEYFRSRAEKRNPGKAISDIIVLPESVYLDAANFISSIELKIWSRLARLSWRPFDKARAFARSLELRVGDEWKAFCRLEFPGKGVLPDDIPAAPWQTYKHEGWQGMGDWLGTGRVSNRLRVFRPFEEARAFVRSLELRSETEWRAYYRGELSDKGTIPIDIPSHPDRTYRNYGWNGMGDWLGTGNISPGKRTYRPFEEARNFARSLGLKSGREWRSFCRSELPGVGTLPQDIPTEPKQIYKGQGWQSMGDWLGTGIVATYLRPYRSFEQAKVFVRNLGLKSVSEWKLFCRGELPAKGLLPEDIPANPRNTYKNQGWQSMGDWLGTGTIAPGQRIYRPFEEARTFVRSLGLKSQAEWMAFCRGELPGKGTLPDDIPRNVNKSYKDKGWQGMGDWLGTGTIAPGQRIYRPFEETRTFVRSLGLKTQAEWMAFCRGELPGKGTLPDDIPASPSQVYKGKGWKNFGDWLGTGNIALRLRIYRPFEEAREFVRNLALKNLEEWRLYSSGNLSHKGLLPKDIPANPNRIYKDQGWQSYGDWIGTGTIASHLKIYRAFEDARAFARDLGLKNHAEWKAFCHGEFFGKGTLPEDIPATPWNTYKKHGWLSIGDWLGTGSVAPQFRIFRPFNEARNFARRLELKNWEEWRAFCRGELPGKGALPGDIPTNPNIKYKDQGWRSSGDWLGTESVSNKDKSKDFRPFEVARAFARSLGLINYEEWRAFCRGDLPEKGVLPRGIPSAPNQVYRDSGWQGMGDWLGTGIIAPNLKNYRPFEEARAFARSLGLKNWEEWRSFCCRKSPETRTMPEDIPTAPWRTYKNKGWKNMKDWLGRE